MECLFRHPWETAFLVIVLLAAAFGGVMQRWAALEKEPRNWPGFWLGLCEAVIFMAAFAGAGAIGAAWLGFKVASKWKSWELIKDVRVRAESVVSFGHRSFLLGTAGNIVIGLAGTWIAMGMLGAAPLFGK